MRYLPILFLVGCLSTDVATFSEHPPRPADHEVTVYAADTAHPDELKDFPLGPPPGKRIGKVRLVGAWKYTRTSLINRAKQRARAIGGDSVLITDRQFDPTNTLDVEVYRR